MPQSEHIQQLDAIYARLQALAGEPEGAVSFAGRQRLGGRGFFPGASGFYSPHDLQRVVGRPQVSAMVVAHNWGSEKDWHAFQTEHGEPIDKVETWIQMLAFFAEAGIDPHDCFYTNVYPVLMRGEKSTGAIRGRKSAQWLDACVALLSDQIELLQPKVLLVLGKDAVALMARFPDEAFGKWRQFSTFRVADKIRISAIESAQVRGRDLAAVALMHPSYRAMNIRRYRGNEDETGHMIEVRMVRTLLGG